MFGPIVTTIGATLAKFMAAATVAVRLAIMVVSSYVMSALAPKPPEPKPAMLEDFQIPQIEEGRPVGVVFGHVIIKGPTLAWYGDLKTQKIKKKSGKK